jgi:hypothetical protein
MSFSVGWIEGCEIEGEASQSFWEPVPGWDCEKLMLENFLNCKDLSSFLEWIIRDNANCS